MKYAYKKGIDLTGPDAPKTVIDGVRDLVRLKGAHSGILAEVDDESYLRDFAERNLVIGVTGGTRREDSLCFTFVDNGEGQHAKDFEDTFLSLSKGNKSDIPFVQGKYNMGSSGVLNYCGRRWYKLIISRRYDESGNWGWTLVRRRSEASTPIAEYFRPVEGIPSFLGSVLHPLKLQSGEPDYKVHLSSGTIIKLFDYYMESAASFRNIRESINENLVSTILPFRLMDYRWAPQRTGRRKEGVDERPFYGMEFLLLRKEPEDVAEFESQGQVYEPRHAQHIGDDTHPDLGHISVSAIVLERDLPGWLKAPRNNSRVFHAVNGQVQFKDSRGYLSQTCRLPGLKDRIVVIVDASNLSEAAHNDVWKSDRENIRVTEIGQSYRDRVTELIRKSDYLKELQRRIAREETEKVAQEGQVALFQDLVDTDPSIAQLLPGGELVKLQGDVGRARKEDEEWEGKYSPTFLELIGRSVRQEGAEIAFDGLRRLTFKTDVDNDYLTRPDNRGRVSVTAGVDDKFSYSTALRNGQLTITFQSLSDKVDPGDEFEFSVELLDDAMPQSVTEELKLIVVESRRVDPPGKPSNRKRDGPWEPGDEEESTEGRTLPPMRWLTKDGRSIGGDETERWPDDFTDQDGGKVEDLGEDQRTYLINYDNAHFHRFLDSERDELNKKVVTEQFRISMLVLMMGLEDAYSRMEQTDTKFQLEECIDEIRRLAAQGASTVVMSIAKTLPTIINPASLADADD
ncbi:MAG: hypothetical protein OXE05_10200 [Chloroflexi bacterium]|nr:hypothetical protein [Chloroflexota bacterium]